MEKPKVSIIIRTKNEEKWLGKVLEKLYQQTFQDFEIIIIDSGSTDKTLEIIEKFPVKLIRIKPEEFNYSYSLNLGILQSKGKFLCILSGHSLPTKNTWLADGLKNFSDSQVAGVTGPYTALPDGSFSEKRGDFLDKLKKYIGMNYSGYDKREKIYYPLTNTNAIVRKDLWSQYPFDESLKEGCEDYDWSQEMYSRGYKLIRDPKFAVLHSHGGLGRPVYQERESEWQRICKFIDQRKRPHKSSSVLFSHKPC
ncbi:MAG: glycosyltransferase [bacterium]|nr:glycosyltransferase [bacterium]